MTERIGVVRELLLREPRSVARNFVLQASGDREHREAGLDDGTVELDLRFGKGLICYGGQDAVGAAVFPLSEENSIQAVMVAADGCSFGDKTNSAKAAKIAVEHNLSGWDYLIHKNEVPKMVMLRGIINKVNELVVSELNEGVTTVTVAVVSHELVNGRKQIFLDIAWVGDSQVMLLGFDNENNSYFVEKLVIPHDCLYGLILNKLELEDDIGMKCSQTSLLQARKDALNKLQEICVPYKPDIFAHLGEHKGKTGLVRISTRTINISQEYLSSGKNGLKLVVCSDNLGDKVPEDIIRESYLQHFNDNSAFATSLGRYMANQDLDDGCMVVADLGFNSGN